jgi:hypothetical protein
MRVVDKNQAWKQIFERVARIVDRRGKKIDPGIMGVVLALNANGIRTTQSCEGHIDWGFPYPWVRVVEQSCSNLERFLEAFYDQHQMLYDRMLMIEHLLDDEYMLRSHGGILQERRDLAKRTEKLKEYQEEMQKFTAFLKQCYFEV